MWVYEKKLQYPVKVNNTNPRLAKLLLSQYGGPDGELSAALRYLNQRFTMPTNNTKALVTDIGTEELSHLEIIGTLAYKLTKDADREQIMMSGYDSVVDHGRGIFYVSATGNPWTATYIQVKDDPIADLTEDLAAEQKARATYNRLMNLTDDASVIDVLRFLREREIVHYQRFGEALVQVQENYACKKFF